MKDFEDFFCDPQYTQAYGFDVSKGICYVEDEADVTFWEDYFKFFNVEGYDIRPVVSNLNQHRRGKDNLEKMFSSLHMKAIVALDSDYDYLCPNGRGEISRQLNNNKYVLQTFYYSRESYNYRILKLNLILKRIRYTYNHNFNIDDFIIDYSKLCFKALLPVLFIIDRNINVSYEGYQVSKKTIKNILRIKNKEKFTDENFKINTNVLRKLEIKINDFISNFLEQIDIDDYESYKKDIINIKLFELDSYQYISGHLLESNLNNLCEHLIKLLMYKESKKIVQECSGISPASKKEHIDNQINKMKSHFRNRCSYLTLLHDTTHENFTDSCYEKLNQKRSQMLTS